MQGIALYSRVDGHQRGILHWCGVIILSFRTLALQDTQNWQVMVTGEGYILYVHGQAHLITGFKESTQLTFKHMSVEHTQFWSSDIVMSSLLMTNLLAVLLAPNFLRLLGKFIYWQASCMHFFIPYLPFDHTVNIWNTDI